MQALSNASHASAGTWTHCRTFTSPRTLLSGRCETSQGDAEKPQTRRRLAARRQYALVPSAYRHHTVLMINSGCPWLSFTYSIRLASVSHAAGQTSMRGWSATTQRSAFRRNSFAGRARLLSTQLTACRPPAALSTRAGLLKRLRLPTAPRTRTPEGVQR